MEFLRFLLVSAFGFAAALAGAYSITCWMTRGTRKEDPSFKIDFQLHPNHALHKHQLFWLVALTPVAIGLVLNIKIFSVCSFDFSINGFEYWVKNSTLTLGLMALGIPFGVMVGSFHRTLQTAEQIKQAESANNFKNHSEHRELFISGLNESVPSCKLDRVAARNIYYLFFGNSSGSNFLIDIENPITSGLLEWRQKMSSCFYFEILESVAGKGDDEKKSILKDRYECIDNMISLLAAFSSEVRIHPKTKNKMSCDDFKSLFDAFFDSFSYALSFASSYKGVEKYVDQVKHYRLIFRGSEFSNKLDSLVKADAFEPEGEEVNFYLKKLNSIRLFWSVSQLFYQRSITNDVFADTEVISITGIMMSNESINRYGGEYPRKRLDTTP